MADDLRIRLLGVLPGTHELQLLAREHKYCKFVRTSVSSVLVELTLLDGNRWGHIVGSSNYKVKNSNLI